MILRDKLGWPVEWIMGRPITNTIRLLIHTNVRQTWKHRDGVDSENERDLGGTSQSAMREGTPRCSGEDESQWRETVPGEAPSPTCLRTITMEEHQWTIEAKLADGRTILLRWDLHGQIPVAVKDAMANSQVVTIVLRRLIP